MKKEKKRLQTRLPNGHPLLLYKRKMSSRVLKSIQHLGCQNLLFLVINLPQHITQLDVGGLLGGLYGYGGGRYGLLVDTGGLTNFNRWFVNWS